MKPTEITINRKFNLGNYENIDVTIKATLNQNEDPVKALQEAECLIMAYFASRPAAKIAQEIGKK